MMVRRRSQNEGFGVRISQRFSGLGLVSLLACVSIATAQQINPGKTRIEHDGALNDPAVAAQAAGGGTSVLVHLEANADRGPIRAWTQGRGGFVQYEYDILPNLINIRGIPQDALNALGQVPGVARWELDGEVHMHMNDSTPLIRALQSQITGAGFTADGTGVRVCVIDTGIDSDHTMYSARIDTAAGRDFVNGDNNPEDDNGHGSHVSGTVLGRTGLTVDFGCVGSEPFQGVAPNATLIGVKVLDAGGGGSFSNVIAGINYCADQTASGGRADVINMSLGGGQFSGNCDSDSAAAAANAAVDAGVVVVASSGNDDFSNAMGTPACGSKVISVGATYDDTFPNCEFPSQSSFTFCTRVSPAGTCTRTCTDNSPQLDQIGCYSNNSSVLDVVAPGCITFSADSTNSPNGIVGFCGTSMASPHVAGLAALLLDLNPSLTPAQVRQAIRAGAIDLGAAGYDAIYGYGRIDALNSLAAATGCTTNADCDDGNACTTDTCSSGTCSNAPIANCCGNGSCESGETQCNCSADCGNPPSTETNCSDGVDNDCDGLTDGADPNCSCLPVGASCTANSQCCSNSCKGKTGAKTCK